MFFQRWEVKKTPIYDYVASQDDAMMAEINKLKLEQRSSAGAVRTKEHELGKTSVSVAAAPGRHTQQNPCRMQAARPSLFVTQS